MAVRSVQLMVDRGELEAWKTPGGHRRIARASVDRWLAGRQGADADAAPPLRRASDRREQARLLLIEDSRHVQKLIKLLLQQQFPQIELHVADDGIGGLALAGQLQPDVLLLDILLPGIDGATLIAGLRSHPAFARSQLIVVTSLEGDDLQPYAYALSGVPVVHKPRLVLDLPAQLTAALARSGG